MTKEKLKKKVYISGQITGLPEKEYKKLFDSAEDILVEKLKCCENCADYDGQDCDAENENYCRCFTGDKNDDCYWRLKL